MRRLALCALLLATAPLSAQTTGYTPPGGTTGMGVGMSGWAMPVPGGDYAFGLPGNVRARPARADQVRVGYAVRSVDGGVIGKVAYADSNVAVVKSSRYALRLPLKAFGVDAKGLLIELSPASFDKLAEGHGARVG